MSNFRHSHAAAWKQKAKDLGGMSWRRGHPHPYAAISGVTFQSVLTICCFYVCPWTWNFKKSCCTSPAAGWDIPQAVSRSQFTPFEDRETENRSLSSMSVTSTTNMVCCQSLALFRSTQFLTPSSGVRTGPGDVDRRSYYSATDMISSALNQRPLYSTVRSQ